MSLKQEANVYCSNCQCGFTGRSGKCPVCKNALTGESLPRKTLAPSISYDSLLRKVEENDGRLNIELDAVDSCKFKQWTFPWIGWGYSWTKSMKGSANGILVDLLTTEVGTKRATIIPGIGWGFAWEQKMVGDICGHEISLTATVVKTQKTGLYIFRIGWGFGWTLEMAGRCGDRLQAILTTSDVKREKETTFPGIGWGYARMNRAVLTLTVAE